jgi:hypothetical protein
MLEKCYQRLQANRAQGETVSLLCAYLALIIMHHDIAVTELKTAGLCAAAALLRLPLVIIQTTEAITRCAVSQPVRANADHFSLIRCSKSCT